MPKLKKSQRDAIDADHAAGYGVTEIAERNKLHRNTVSRHLQPGKSPVANAANKDPELEAKLRALAAVVRLDRCAKCGEAVLFLMRHPNLFWKGRPCGVVVHCVCGEDAALALHGRQEEFAAYIRAMRGEDATAGS